MKGSDKGTFDNYVHLFKLTSYMVMKQKEVHILVLKRAFDNPQNEMRRIKDYEFQTLVPSEFQCILHRIG